MGDQPPDFDQLPSAAVADALVRLGHVVRSTGPNMRRLAAGSPVVGPAVPVRHFGSVDVFLEAFETAPPGGVLVIDNGGLEDEACIGDLTVAEAKSAGLVGIVLWGVHRDSAALGEIGLPVWSLGSISPGPKSARPRDGDAFSHAHVDELRVTATDVVAADDDGVVFVPRDLWPDVAAAAAAIVRVESAQAVAIAGGRSLRDQLGFRDYLTRKAADPGYTFRQHLAERGGAIET
jgi:regulator of RNase E activity RraA